MADLVMPKLGLTMTEGMLSEWRVAPGSAFAAGDVLFVVETEKVANEIEAETDGVVEEILTPEGETVAVGAVIARLAGGGAAAKPDAAATEAAGGAAPAAPAPLDAPSARKLMAEHGLSRADIAGTGRDGRIMKEDVQRVLATPYARKRAREADVDLRSLTGTGPNGRVKAADVMAAASARSSDASAAASGWREIAPDAARIATARRVSAAKRDIPHFYVQTQAEVSALAELRQQLNAEEPPVRISVTHLLVKAIGVALAEAPALNRIWLDERVLAFDAADVGLVAETPSGLRIPVVRDVGRRPLDAVARDAAALIERGRGGALTPEDVGGGCIALSNVGMFGVASLTPIINPPQAMILGVGAEQALFRPDRAGQPRARRELTLTLACDHRVIDGAEAARFLSRIAALIEAPIRLLRPPRDAAKPQE